MSNPNKEQYSYNYLISKGLSPVHAAGIIGNLKAESNFNTTIKGKADDKGSVGLGQWHSERKTGLYNFAKKQGKDWAEIDTQLDYILHELNTTHKNAFVKLKQTTTPDEAAMTFMNEYERPAEWAKKQSSKLRINTARSAMGLEIDPNFEYKNKIQIETYRNYLADLDTQLPQGTGITFSEDKKEETKTEGEKAVQLLNEENFLEDYADLQYQQAQQQEQQLYQEQAVVTPLEVTPIEYAPPTLPQQEFQDGGKIIKDNNGYWNPNNWGKKVEINSPSITMKGVNQPLIGISKETGEQKLMLPEKEYFFNNTNNVIEVPFKFK